MKVWKRSFARRWALISWPCFNRPGQSYLVRKALEAGAGGVIVPHAHCRKDVEDIVRAAKFPPLGKRGYGGPCLSGQWGVFRKEEPSRNLSLHPDPRDDGSSANALG